MIGAKIVLNDKPFLEYRDVKESTKEKCLYILAGMINHNDTASERNNVLIEAIKKVREI